MQNKYGEKVYKLALDAELSCPNRDENKKGGCIFCADGGSGHFAKRTLEEAKAFLRNQKEDEASDKDVLSNMQYYSDTRSGPADARSEDDNAETPRSYGEGWTRQDKNTGSKFVAYYQTYSNTYTSKDRLKEIFSPALADPEVVEIAIATRPDCINDEVTELLADMNRKKPTWIELGLQTKHDKTADYINRGYHLDVFESALRKLRNKNIDVVVHLIMGLPGEDFNDMLDTVKYVNSLDIQGVKVHMLTVIKGTVLGERYEAAMARQPQGEGLVDLQNKITFEDGTDHVFISLEKYADLICATLGLLRPEIVIHRLTGDAAKDVLLSPMWTADKKRVLNTINMHLERRNIFQGCLID